MAIAPEQLDEASVARRLQEQKDLVDRLIRESKYATEANAKLYELGKLYERILRKTSFVSITQ